MPRKVRLKGDDCAYHLVERGNERKNIFNNDDDKLRLIETIVRMKEKFNFKIYAYCLMDNHIHMLIHTNGNDVSKIMQCINISYVYYFNKSYKRCGHLFQDRFTSRIIDSDSYLLEASKYIHNNPVKAEMVDKPGDYKWSSYGAYSMNSNAINKFIDNSLILGNMSSNKNTAISKYVEYVTKDNSYAYNHIDVDSGLLGMEDVKKFVEENLLDENISFSDMINNEALRNRIILDVARISNLKYSEIGSIFGGLNKVAVCRIVKSHETQEPVQRYTK